MRVRNWIGGSESGSPANSYCQRGEGQLLKERFEAAIQTFNRGLELDSGHTGCWIGMGRAFLGMGIYDRADECFNRALEISHNDPDALAFRASGLRQIALKARDPMKCLEAVELCNRALRSYPESSLALHEKGMALWTIGKQDDAIRLFDQVKKVDPSYTYPSDLKGRYLFEHRRYHEAIEAYEEAIKRDPQNPDLLLQEGRALMKAGMYHRAIQFLNRCLKINPEFSAAWLLLGNSYKVLSRYDDAIEAYEEAMENDPGSNKYRKFIADVYLVKGKDALYKDKNPQKAIEYFDQAIKEIPGYLAGWFSKGVAYRKLGAYRNATACFLKVVDIDPQNAQGYYEMAQILDKTGNSEEAVRCYLETIRCDPSHTDAMFKLGNLLMEKGDLKNALTYFDMVLEKRPDSSVVWFAKGKAFERRGQQKDADRCFEKANKLVTG